MWVLLMLPRFGGARSAQSITASGHTRAACSASTASDQCCSNVRKVEPRWTLMTAVVLTGSGMTRLTEQKTEKLCLIGAIPNDHCDRFGRAVERCVRTYRRLRERKSAPEVEAELAQIEKCIWRALRLLDHATWRAAEFRRVLEDISARLHHLSPAAQDYLDFRHLKIQADGVLAAWLDSTEPGVLIDPVCFTSR